MISQNQWALLELLKASLFGDRPSLSEEIDWKAVFEEAQAQAVIAQKMHNDVFQNGISNDLLILIE